MQRDLRRRTRPLGNVAIPVPENYAAKHGCPPQGVNVLNFSVSGASNDRIVHTVLPQCSVVRPDLLLVPVHVLQQNRISPWLGRLPNWTVDGPAARPARRDKDRRRDARSVGARRGSTLLLRVLHARMGIGLDASQRPSRTKLLQGACDTPTSLGGFMTSPRKCRGVPETGCAPHCTTSSIWRTFATSRSICLRWTGRLTTFTLALGRIMRSRIGSSHDTKHCPGMRRMVRTCLRRLHRIEHPGHGTKTPSLSTMSPGSPPRTWSSDIKNRIGQIRRKVAGIRKRDRNIYPLY